MCKQLTAIALALALLFGSFVLRVSAEEGQPVRAPMQGLTAALAEASPLTQ